MDRTGAEASGGLFCPGCATDLHDFRAEAEAPEETRCPRCGVVLRSSGPVEGEVRVGRACRDVPVAVPTSPPLGGLRLVWRNSLLRLIERLYWVVAFTGTTALLVCGGVIPVVRAWLRNEVDDWAGVVATLGGVWFRVESQNPDSDLGPVLAAGGCAAAVLDDRRGRPTSGGQAAWPGPPDVSAVLRSGGLGRVASPDHRSAALSGPDPGRAARHRRT